MTEKVLEDHSTDASEGEEPVKKAAKEAPKHTQAKVAKQLTLKHMALFN